MRSLAIHATHAVAFGAVRMLAPRAVLNTLRKVASVFSPLDEQSARHAAATLEPFGTCFTRSLAIAALLPESCIVLGGNLAEGDFHGHAWVEIHGRPLRSWDPSGRIVGRVMDRVVL